MPRYLFHVHDSASIIDDEGTELPDLEAARVEAVRLSGEMLRDHAEQFWGGDEWKLEVTDAAGLMLFKLVMKGFNGASANQ
jgi:hypothetical protein